MASSQNNEQSTASEPLGVTIADVFQEQMLDNTENTPQTSIPSAQSVSDLDDLILRDIINSSTVTPVGSNNMTSEQFPLETATSVIEALGVFEKRLSLVCNRDNTSFEVNTGDNCTDDDNANVSQSSTLTGQSHVQRSVMTGDNKQMECKSERHIMISYNHDTSFHICRRICNRLRTRGYKVWMDTNNLHGSIHEGMAEAIENSYIVLFCMNQRYYESEYCKKEVLYTNKNHIDFIPCLFDKSYEPKGWLGIIIGDQLYIDFSVPDKFDEVFEELVLEIQTIQKRLQISTVQTAIKQDTHVMSTFNTQISTNNQNRHDSLTAVICDFRESINQSNRDAQAMTEEEFSEFVYYIRQQIFPNTSPLPRTDNNNSRVLEEILRQSRDQTEFLRKITEVLSNVTEIGTIIKLSLAFACIWTMNNFFKYN